MTERWEAGEEPEEVQTGGRGWFWLALLALTAVCAVAIYRSALFRLEQVTVTGLKNVPEARVLEAAGLVHGAARWDHPAARVKQRLLQEPWIKTAEVTWEWNRVQIHVTEREPVGLLQYTGRFYLQLDVSGTILGQAELDDVKGLPVVSGKQVTTALRGESLTDPGLLDALAVLSWNAPRLRGQISEIAVREDRVLTLYMASGATVKWGKAPIGKERDAALKEKTEYFGGLWNSLKKRGAGCEIDLSVDDKYFASGCD